MSKITILLMEEGKGLRPATIDPSPLGLAPILGESRQEWVPIRSWDGRMDWFTSAVMVCRGTDYDAMLRNQERLPRTYLICEVDGSNLTDLQARNRDTILRSYEKYGVEMLADRERQVRRSEVSRGMFPVIRWLTLV